MKWHIDVFKPSGKWNITQEIDIEPRSNDGRYVSPQDYLKNALDRSLNLRHYVTNPDYIYWTIVYMDKGDGPIGFHVLVRL